MEHGYARCRVFRLGHGEQAVLEVEVVEHLGKHHREDTWLQVHVALLTRRRQVLRLITILKNVLLDRVSMKVQIQEELLVLRLLQLAAQLLRVVDCWMKRLARLDPLPVEIARSQ